MYLSNNWLKAALASSMLAIGAFAAQAAEFKPAVSYDLGGKFDKSFNEAASKGLEKFQSENADVQFAEFEPQNESQIEQAIRNFARRGHNPIVAIGFSQAAALEKVAKEFPDLQFALIDMVVELPNVRSIVFKEHEGSYLVGILAAMASQSGKVGFVGGMDIPLIRRFACGYVQGVKSVKSDAEVFQNMTGTTGAAWNDPVKGGELAKSQFDRGADVVYQAAGGTGVGVLQAAADAGKLAIGVDSNQNYLQPGNVLTSMLKRVDVAVYNALADSKNGKWTNDINVLGLKEDGVSWSLDEFNEKLISADMKAAVDKAKEGIISGTISVHDYMSDNNCPM